MRGSTISHRAVSSSTRVAAGAPAMSAKARSSFCSRSGVVSPVRELLKEVFRNQKRERRVAAVVHVLERERHVRAGDSHGDIVFWPLLALAPIPAGFR